MSKSPIQVISWDGPIPPSLLDLGPSRRVMTDTERENWERARATNPDLHDSPIFEVAARDSQAGEILVNRSSYSLLVAGHPPVIALGVTGVIIRDGAQEDELLLGRRSPRTRLYGGTWETAPRGTVPVPMGETPTDAIVSALIAEAKEELDKVELNSFTPIAMVQDDQANSLDVVYVTRVDPTANPSPASWEYDAVAWMPVAKACEWANGSYSPTGVFAGSKLSLPTAALLSSGLI